MTIPAGSEGELVGVRLSGKSICLDLLNNHSCDMIHREAMAVLIPLREG